MTCRGRMILAALLVASPAGLAQAGELAGSVNVRDGIVYVEVDDDGKPAVGVKVRLQHVRDKEVVAQGKINAEGKWSWPLLKAGAYEVIIDPGQLGQTPLVLPVDQREQVDPSDPKKCPHHEQLPKENVVYGQVLSSWLPAGLGAGLLAGCGLMLWFRKSKRLPANDSFT